MAQHHTVTLKVTAYITKSITTSDEEYKVFKLIDWDREFENSDAKLTIDYDSGFEVVDDDSYWVEDDEIDG
jgi:hypothetical protein